MSTVGLSLGTPRSCTKTVPTRSMGTRAFLAAQRSVSKSGNDSRPVRN